MRQYCRWRRTRAGFDYHMGTNPQLARIAAAISTSNAGGKHATARCGHGSSVYDNRCTIALIAAANACRPSYSSYIASIHYQCSAAALVTATDAGGSKTAVCSYIAAIDGYKARTLFSATANTGTLVCTGRNQPASAGAM